MGDAAVAIGGEHDHRRDRERDEGELPAVHEEHSRHGNDSHDVLREEDQAVAEEEAHRLEVDRRSRHELARLAAVVEAERQAEEVRVSSSRRSYSTASACRPEITRRPYMSAPRTRPSADDRCDLEREHARVGAARELVDHDSGEDRHEDSRDLRARSRAATRRPAMRGTGGGSPSRLTKVCRRRRVRRGLVGRHGLVGYGSCSRPCPTSPKGATARSIATIERAFARSARVLDVHSDPDHHRSVFTLVGDADELVEALLAGHRGAPSRSIDLRAHDGSPPEGRRGRRRPARAARPDDDMELAKATARSSRRADRRRSSGFPSSSTARSGAGDDLPSSGAAGSRSSSAASRSGSSSRTAGPTASIRGREPCSSARADRSSPTTSSSRRTTSESRGRSPRPCASPAAGCPACRRSGCSCRAPGCVQVSMNVLDIERAPLHEVVDACRARGGVARRRRHGRRARRARSRARARGRARGGVELPGVDESRVLERRAGALDSRRDADDRPHRRGSHARRRLGCGGRRTPLRRSPSRREGADARCTRARRLDSTASTRTASTPGFGRFVSTHIPEELAEELQLRLLRSHACGVGEPYPDEVVAGGDAPAREHAREGLLRRTRRRRSSCSSSA